MSGAGKIVREHLLEAVPQGAPGEDRPVEKFG